MEFKNIIERKYRGGTRQQHRQGLWAERSCKEGAARAWRVTVKELFGLDQKDVRLRDNKPHHNRLKTHAWFLWALIISERRQEGRGNKGKGEWVVGELAENLAFDHSGKNYQLDVHCRWAPTPKHHVKCSY